MSTVQSLDDVKSEREHFRESMRSLESAFQVNLFTITGFCNNKLSFKSKDGAQSKPVVQNSRSFDFKIKTRQNFAKSFDKTLDILF